MRLVVTGGGTGGHVFPALEIARTARDQGVDVHYFGSLRGQEGRVCRDFDIPFTGFATEPLYSLKSWRGIRSAFLIAKATSEAKRALQKLRPDAVLSTGGYSSAPVVSAAGTVGIPYVIHEQNTVPGRTNRILSKKAFAVATTFKTGAEHFAGSRVVRTGMPIRRELRLHGQGQFHFDVKTPKGEHLAFVMGGSQGAHALNEAALSTAVRMAGHQLAWLVAAGPKNFAAMETSRERLGVSAEFDIRAFLSAEEMAQAYSHADMVVCRSGGSLAELAACRRPGILIPLPSSFANHQLHNAREFEAMGAADVILQSDLSPSTLESRILGWMNEPDRLRAAQSALADWDIPDASERVLALIRESVIGTIEKRP